MRNKIKGIKIIKSYERIYFNLFLVTFISLSLLIFISYVRITEKNINQLIDQPYDIFSILLISLIIVGIVSICFYIFAKKQLRYLGNLNKLCKVITNNGFYIMEDKKNQKQVVYFPQFYYFEDAQKILITIKLDGSKFHQNFLELGSIFEQLFNCELQSQIVKNGYIYYEMFKLGDVKRISLTDNMAVRENNYKIPLMSNLQWDVIKVPHAFITGPTGAGKTYFLFYLIKYLLEFKCIVKIIDPKKSNLSKLSSVLGESNVAFDKETIIRQLEESENEMNDRYITMHDSRSFKVNETFVDSNLRPYFLIFDEFVSFTDLCDESEKDFVYEKINHIILKGRQVGIFIILTTQRTEEETLRSSIIGNLGLRVSLGNLSRAGYEILFGDVDKQYGKRTENGQGYIYLNGVSNNVLEFYSPLIPDDYDFIEDIRRIAEKNGTTFQHPTDGGTMPYGYAAQN